MYGLECREAERLIKRIDLSREPLRVAGQDEQRRLLASWEMQLGQIQGTRTTLRGPESTRYQFGNDGSRARAGAMLEIGLIEPDQYSSSCTVKVGFRGDILSVRLDYSDDVPIADIGQVKMLMEMARDRLEEKREKAIKRQKISNLKSRSIEASIQTLAQDLQFDYYIHRMQTKIKLTVRLGDVDGLAIDVPFGRFQEVLGGLRKLIETVFELYGQGIRFKVGGAQKIRYWTRCEKPDTDVRTP